MQSISQTFSREYMLRRREKYFLTAGFPCQDISIAGKREGLAGKRSGLFWELARHIELSTPDWFILENVPGLLSSNSRKDMWTVITTLEQFGYCVAWRILDAQYFGVAQRRRRVWIVGSLRNISSVKVLFIEESSRGNDKEKQAVGERGFCVSTRDGEQNDPTNETFVASTIREATFNSATGGGGGNLVASTISAGRDFNNKPNDSNIYVVGFTVGTTDFTGATGSTSRNIVAQTINAGKRGNAGRLWEDTHIAEINPTGKREVDGLSRKLYSDGVRGKALGNAIVPQVAQVIMEAIKRETKCIK
jgi:DNA-cytosine methyltransferase